jgi:prophage antirepressor-like protein
MEKTYIQEDHGKMHLVFFGEHCVQAIERDWDLWFLAEDLGVVLELTNIRKNLRELKDDEKDWCYKWVKPKWQYPFEAETEGASVTKSYRWGQEKGPFEAETEGASVTKTYTCPQRKKVRVVNEPGLYRLIMMSRTPAAKQFQDLVVREILPAIRKTGKYKHRKTTPLAFMPKSMSELDMTRINLRERPRLLEWVEP